MSLSDNLTNLTSHRKQQDKLVKDKERRAQFYSFALNSEKQPNKIVRE